jgi:hypothetical protein
LRAIGPWLPGERRLSRTGYVDALQHRLEQARGIGALGVSARVGGGFHGDWLADPA